MRDTIKLWFPVVALLAISSPLFAHHGAAQFEATKILTLKGTVVEWVWANPHCFLKFDVKDASGNVAHWVAETSNPPDMINRGWSEGNLQARRRSYCHRTAGEERQTHRECYAGTAIRRQDIECRRQSSHSNGTEPKQRVLTGKIRTNLWLIFRFQK